jgi:hypothetical protein
MSPCHGAFYALCPFLALLICDFRYVSSRRFPAKLFLLIAAFHLHDLLDLERVSANSPPTTDPCTQNATAAAFAANSSSLPCSDPYFGGDPRCCYDSAAWKCATCPWLLAGTGCITPNVCIRR